MRQYTVAILLALACGPLLGSVPLFTHTVIGGVGLRTSHALSIIGVSGALLMLWLLSHRAARQIPEDGKGLTFARAILPPLATVILVFIGYQMLLLLDGPVFGARERSVYRSGYLVGIMGAAAWLTLTWVRNAGALTKFVEVRLSNGERMDATLRLPRSAETTSTVITGARKDADGAGILDSRSVASSLGRYE
ncbi:MAG: hypothetical protein ACREJU_17145, partial [Nitrospiraceae bacterium]